MAYTLRPLSFGELFDATFHIYRQNFALFAGISAIPYTVLLLTQIGMTVFGGYIPGKAATTASSLLSFIALMFVSTFVGSILTAATTFGVSDIYLDIPTSIGSCFSRVMGRVVTVVYVSFVFGLAVGLGFVACIVPGIYLAGKYGLSIPAAVLEEGRGGTALNRSAQLTQGSVGRIIVIYFLATLVTGTIVFAGTFALVFVVKLAHLGTLVGTVLQQVMSTVVGIFVAPLSSIALTLAYYDQRIRKEGFDIERMMAMLQAPNPSASAPAS